MPQGLRKFSENSGAAPLTCTGGLDHVSQHFLFWAQMISDWRGSYSTEDWPEIIGISWFTKATVGEGGTIFFITELNPFRAPKPLPILISSKKGFQL